MLRADIENGRKEDREFNVAADPTIDGISRFDCYHSDSGRSKGARHQLGARPTGLAVACDCADLVDNTRVDQVCSISNPISIRGLGGSKHIGGAGARLSPA